jgi:hypothetical protein
MDNLPLLAVKEHTESVLLLVNTKHSVKNTA